MLRQLSSAPDTGEPGADDHDLGRRHHCHLSGDAPRAPPRRPGLELDQVDARPQGVRRTRHRLDRDGGAAALGRLERVARVHHEVAERIVDPDPDRPTFVGPLQHRDRPADLVAKEPVNAVSRRVAPTGRGDMKSASLPMRACLPVGRPRSSAASCSPAGTWRWASSMRSVPTVTYGWNPIPNGAGTSERFVASASTSSPPGPTAYRTATSSSHG